MKKKSFLIAGRHAVIVGRSNIVGKPLMNLLSGKYDIGNATVTICHTGTKDISQFTKIADIIIANLNIDLKQKQELLEITSTQDRLDRIYKERNDDKCSIKHV